MLGATLVAPGHNHVVPLPPEFIVPQDGSDKQDCESRAARRWLASHGTQYARLRPVYLGDDLFANQPMCEAIQTAGGNFVFTCKPASHKLIQEYIIGVELPTHSVRVKRGRAWVTHRFRWLNEAPLRDGRDALKVNWFEIEIVNAAGDVTYRNSFITDLPVDRDTVADLAACGRARWKIENETFNVLKNKAPRCFRWVAHPHRLSVLGSNLRLCGVTAGAMSSLVRGGAKGLRAAFHLAWLREGQTGGIEGARHRTAASGAGTCDAMVGFRQPV